MRPYTHMMGMIRLFPVDEIDLCLYMTHRTRVGFVDHQNLANVLT